MLGKIEGKRKKGWQDEMGGCYHWLNGYEFEQTQGDTEGQGNQARAAVCGVAKCQTQLSNFTTTY